MRKGEKAGIIVGVDAHIDPQTVENHVIARKPEADVAIRFSNMPHNADTDCHTSVATLVRNDRRFRLAIESI